MTKKELLEKAEKLGLEVSEDMTKAEIQEVIDSAEEPEEADGVEEVEEEIEEDEVEEADEPQESEEEEPNTAVVLNDSGNELRRFTLEAHGENFVELAKSYCDKHECRYKLIKAKPVILCPHCGGRIYRS